MSCTQFPMDHISMEGTSAQYPNLLMSTMLPAEGYNLSYQVATSMAEKYRKSSTDPSTSQVNHYLSNNDFLSRYPDCSSPHTQVTLPTADWTTNFPATTDLPPSPCPSNASQHMSLQGHQYGITHDPIGNMMQTQQRLLAMQAQDRRLKYATMDFDHQMTSVNNLPTPSPEAQLLEEYHTAQLYQPQQAFTVSHQAHPASIPESTADTTYDHPKPTVESNTMLTPVTTPNFPDSLTQPEDPKEDIPYARLIQKALLSTNTHAMTLRNIYRWFEKNTDKTDGGTYGWQNSIRHNLSMNQAFKRREREDVSKKKIAEWVLETWAITAPVQSTTRYRKPASRGPVRVLSGSGERIQANQDNQDTQDTFTRKALPTPKPRNGRLRNSPVATRDRLAEPAEEIEHPVVNQATTSAVTAPQMTYTPHNLPIHNVTSTGATYTSHHLPNPNVTSTGATYQELVQTAPTHYYAHEYPVVNQATTTAGTAPQIPYHSHHLPIPNVTSTGATYTSHHLPNPNVPSTGATYQELVQTPPTQHNPDIMGQYTGLPLALPLALPLLPACTLRSRPGPTGIKKPVPKRGKRKVAESSTTQHSGRFGDMSAYGGTEAMIEAMTDMLAADWTTQPILPAAK